MFCRWKYARKWKKVVLALTKDRIRQYLPNCCAGPVVFFSHTILFYIKKVFSSNNLFKIKTICPLRGPFWNCFWSFFIGAKLLLAMWRERIVDKDDAKFSLIEINALNAVETYCIFQNIYIYSHTFFDSIIFFMGNDGLSTHAEQLWVFLFIHRLISSGLISKASKGGCATIR